jgi:Uma2 family endonuclease
MSANPALVFTPLSEYLDAERDGNIRHEYVHGRVYAMTGGSVAHNRIVGNLVSALRRHLAGTPCSVFFTDVKVRVDAGETAVYYPDIAVTCRPVDNRAYWIDDPQIVMEVLSPSTMRTDLEEKLHNYQRIESLQEYATVAQDAKLIQVHLRLRDGWNFKTFAGEEEPLELSSIGLVIPMADIYADVL